MYFDVRGNKTYAATGGKEFDSALPTVMFVHGSGLDHRCWALQTRWFAYNGYSVLAPDLPGHSLSEGEALESIEEMGAWLADFLHAAGVDKVHAIGHSQGFLDVLELANLAPELLKSITGIGTAGAIPVNPALLEAAQKSASDAAHMLLMWGFGSDAQFGVSAVPGMQPIAIGRQIMSQNPLYQDLLACANYQRGDEIAAKIKVPAQMILARKDKLTPLKAGLAFADILGAGTTIIEGYGHMLPIEAPKVTLHTLQSLIGKLENQGAKHK
ncbi:MAG: pimeloyl-ACP methyl ester carboxylesterase [Planctomycetota bacterium]|jgi:pimeloyl-ACP methyl ester carboxylesterase